MANRSRIAQQAFDLAEPIVAAMGIDLVDCEYKKEGSAIFLRIFVDKKGGIQIDECEAVSKALDPVFDENLISGHDYFEVSSPGLDRPLKSPSDFRRHVGEEVEISLYRQINGKKKITGTIAIAGDESVCLRIGDVEEEFPYSELANCKRVIHFS